MPLWLGLCGVRLQLAQQPLLMPRCAARLQVNALCRRLGANGAALALQLCDSFGIPDHLLQAPIATDWKAIST
jgi:hypothetical protein